VLIALGLKKTLAHVGDPLTTETAVAMLGGTALYLLAHIAFRLRNVRTLNRQRLVCAVVLIALVPLAVHLASLATLAILAAVLAVLIIYEAVRFADSRERVRRAGRGNAAGVEASQIPAAAEISAVGGSAGGADPSASFPPGAEKSVAR
jgi:low temperature requirement protein LtrA